MVDARDTWGSQEVKLKKTAIVKLISMCLVPKSM